jgi:HAD superfamily hydrolase (TIGR01509 family)
VRYNAPMGAVQAVTFDAGQTIIELDLPFLARRLGERGVAVAAEALGAAVGDAWRRYDALVAGGAAHPWKQLMTAILEGAGIADVTPHVEWLWREQPTANLWRAPIAPMVALARELAARGVRVGVLSNSEGRLEELLTEIGVVDAFAAVVDSGRVGIEKPDPRIFAHALEALGLPRGADAVHIGDSYAADVVGALGAGWRAVWYGRVGEVPAADAGRVAVARDAGEVRAALRAWGV